MRRRDLIAGLLLATTIAHAYAQQKTRGYRIAVVNPSSPVDRLRDAPDDYTGFYSAFFQRLRELGYIEGENLVVERYSAEGREDRFAELAAEVVRSNPDVIFVVSSRLTGEFKAATHTIPIVANVADPIAAGIVPSLARPGGNITGVSVDAGLEIWGKRLELLHELIPAASRVGYVASRRVWESPYGAAAREAAQRLKISLVGPPLDTPLQAAEYRRVFAAMTEKGAEAVLVGDQADNNTNARLILELAEKNRLPTLHSYPYFARLGGLIGYGIEFRGVTRRIAEQVDQILKGAKPGDIPFYQPTKFELAINLKTAKALGITVPPTLLIAADEVIE